MSKGLEGLRVALSEAANLKGQAAKNIRALLLQAITKWTTSYGDPEEEITSKDLTPEQLAELEVLVEEIKYQPTKEAKNA